jgi:tetratricopeptide (TPR) repeat protein
MFLVRRIVCVITLLLIARPLLGAATTAPDNTVDQLIQSLGDPDPSMRQRAAEKLAAMGTAARPALVQAARSPSPQISSRAAEVLMRLPWWIPSDPDKVREELVKYGAGGNEDRKQVISELAIIPGGEPALLRLVQEEPSDAVAWHATLALRLLEDDKSSQALRAMDLTDSRVQVVALAARAFLPVDHAKGIELLRRAVEDDADDDGSDEANLDFAYRVLIADALDKSDLKGALKLQRLRVQRAANAGDASPAVFELLALYADHGITDEFTDDLTDNAASLGKPEVMYALARLENLLPDGSNLLKDALGRCALAGSLTSDESHLRVAAALSDRAWDDETRQELYPILAYNEPHPDMMRLSMRYEAHRLLALTAEIEDDHPGIVENLEAQMKDLETSPGGSDDATAQLKNQIDSHKMHIALANNDKRTADKLLHELITIPDPDTDVAIEVVNALKSQDRGEDAENYFNKAYRLQKEKITGVPLKIGENLNNLAWLCARCGERGDEAVAMAKRAMAVDPGNYMYIDTAASAYFVAGDSAKAVELEKSALNMRPRDVFMQRQLEMFEKGKKD